MNKAVKIIVPLLLAIIVVFSVCWYLFIYDRDFTQDFLLNRARAADNRGNYSVATWFYDMAYRHSHEDEEVAIELAEQFKSNGNYTKAEYTLSNAIADGGSAKLYMALCKTYIEQDKLLDAVTMLDNIAEPNIKKQLDRIRPKAPDFSPQDGYYNEYVKVTLQSGDGQVYMTTDGEYPSINNAPFTGEFQLPGGETTIYALTVGDNGLVSPLRILGYTVAGVIEEITIKDPALDTIIREALNVSEAHSLYTNQLWNVKSITITNEVKDLSELSSMPFLESLTIQEGSYDNLSVLANLTDLKTLKIDGVTLTSDTIKAISALPELTHLSLPRCNLSSISDLSAAVNVTELDLSNNTIRDLEPLSKLTELTQLNLQHNAITQLTALTGASKLKELDISYNSVKSTVALSGCKSLEILRADHNNLTGLEGLDKLPALKLLSVGNNQINDISHLSKSAELAELNIANNKVADLSTLSGILKLSALDFSNNLVTELPDFAGDSPLSTINGSGNQLTSLAPLKGLTQLNYVNMDQNAGISSLSPLKDCSALVEVSVYGTSVTDASALTDLNIIVKYTPVNAG